MGSNSACGASNEAASDRAPPLANATSPAVKPREKRTSASAMASFRVARVVVTVTPSTAWSMAATRRRKPFGAAPRGVLTMTSSTASPARLPLRSVRTSVPSSASNDTSSAPASASTTRAPAAGTTRTNPTLSGSSPPTSRAKVGMAAPDGAPTQPGPLRKTPMWVSTAVVKSDVTTLAANPVPGAHGALSGRYDTNTPRAVRPTGPPGGPRSMRPATSSSPQIPPADATPRSSNTVPSGGPVKVVAMPEAKKG